MRVTERGRHVQVLNHYAKPRTEGGANRHIELFGRLSSAWTFTIVASNFSGHTHRRLDSRSSPNFRFVPVVPYSSNGLSRILNWASYAVMAVVSSLTGPRPSIVYASSPHLLTPLAGWVVSRVRRARLVVEVRDLWPQTAVEMGFVREGSMLHRALSALERWLYRRADHIVAVTDGWTDHFARLGVGQDKVTVISNGAEPTDFDVRPDVPPWATRVGRAGPFAVYAGAHGAANGLDFVLDAAAITPHLTYVLVGDGERKAALVERASREGISNVVFLDLMPKDELSAILGTADVGIHCLADVPLFKIGMSPNKMYDYMAAEVPVVTNAGGAAARIVEAAGAGLAVEPDGLAAGLGQILALSAEERASIGAAGRSWLTANASRSVMAARLEDLLATVAERSR